MLMAARFTQRHCVHLSSGKEKGQLLSNNSMNIPTFADELRQSPINIPRAALCFAREIAYPELNVFEGMAQIQSLAAGAAEHLSTADTAPDRAIRLAEYLFQDLAYEGNAAYYDDPDNSYLNAVLERKLGIPITLSVLFVAVARQVGIAANGVGLPGHFIVSVSHDGSDTLIDPFHDGVLLAPADCERLVRETTGYNGPFQQSWLKPAAPRDILARMLNNLRLIYFQRESWDLARAVLEHLQLVEPDTPEHLRDLGLVHFQGGSIQVAAGYIEAYLERAPKAPEAEELRRGLRPYLDSWVRRN